MSNILDASGHKIATIGEDGKVRNAGGVVLGHVSNDDHVFNTVGIKIGYVDSKGYVYRGGSHVGTVHGDGRVYDYEEHYLGKIIGDHIESGGAALLLLIR